MLPPPPSPSPEIAALVARLRVAGCVFAEAEAELLVADAATPAELEAMVRRRESGLPLEQVLGWAEICGVRVAVAPGVFVPRHRSELLVLEAVRRSRPGAVVVDMCCGTGALGVAVASLVGGVQLHAADADPAAVACAGRNVGAVRGRAYEGDLFAALPAALRGHVDVVLANTPYVPSADVDLLPHEAHDHEPRLALDGGVDGLDLQRRVAAAVPAWLAPGGHVLMETSDRQAAGSLAILESQGLRARLARRAELEATVVIGTRTR